MGSSESSITGGCGSWWSRTVVHLQNPTDLQMSGAPVTHTSPTRDHLHADDENDNMYQTDTLLSPTPSISTNVGKVCQLSCPGMSSKTRTMRSPVCNPAGPCENDGPDPYRLAAQKSPGPGGYCAKIGQSRYRKGVRGSMQLGDPRASTANLDYHDGVRQRDMAFTAVRHRPSNMAKMSPKRGINDIPSADKLKEARNAHVLSCDPIPDARPDPYDFGIRNSSMKSPGYVAKIGQPRYRKGVRGPMQLGDPRASTANLDYHDGVSKQRDMAFTAVRHRPSNMAKMSPKRGIDDIPSADKMKEARNSKVLSSDLLDAAAPDPYNSSVGRSAAAWNRGSVVSTSMASRKPRFSNFSHDSDRGYLGTRNMSTKNLTDMFRFFNKR